MFHASVPLKGRNDYSDPVPVPFLIFFVLHCIYVEMSGLICLFYLEVMKPFFVLEVDAPDNSHISHMC